MLNRSRLMKRFMVLLAMTLGTAGLARAAAEESAADPDVKYQKFILPNGLTLLVHEDHKAPIVAVDVWYHVGSKNEKPGKTGFAHLFEHLMFNGSEHFNDDYFQAMERIGATNLNGTTAEDRTNYFENVPTSALDTALWMESDRMGYMIKVIDQAKLDEQRGVVQNEKRQGENQPYAVARELISKGCFPPGHPYSWTVIGSMDDLSSASLADVHQWFRTYYGAANAVLTVAGDVDPKTVRAKVEKYFGEIPSGPPVARPKAWIAKRSGTVRQVAQDRVPAARIYKLWNVPQWGTKEAVQLDLAAAVLGSGKTSRLYKRLVYDEQLATDVSVFNSSMEIAGLFYVVATAKTGVSLAKVERALDEEMARFIKEGPTEKELARVKAQSRSGFIQGLESIGGFGGKADLLNEGQTYGGNPAAYKNYLKYTRETTPQNVLATVRKWLSDGVFILEIQPFGQYATVKSNVDRTTVPQAGTPPDAQFPKLERATLRNGLKVILAERNNIPMLKLNMVLDAGDAADQFAQPATADLTMSMLDEGTKSRSSLEINDALANLGAGLGSSSGEDDCTVSMSVLKEKLDPALELYADLILHPSFPEADFARLKSQILAGIRQSKASPPAMARRVLDRILYGEGHPYGQIRTEAAVTKITREDLVKFHQTWFKPNNATLIVVGATTLPEITGKLEKLFQEWTPGEVPKKKVEDVKLPEKPAIYILDKPDAQQSYILAAQIAPPKANPEEVAIETMNQILGGAFTSRINMNLREGKHWSYGARSGFSGARGQRSFTVSAPVQADKTGEALIEIQKELTGALKGHPITPAEFDKTQENKILRLGGTWETMDAIGGSIGSIVNYGLPDDYYHKYPAVVRGLKLEEVNKAAASVLHPERMIWIVAGDRAKVEKPLRGLAERGFGEVHVIDADGQEVK